MTAHTPITAAPGKPITKDDLAERDYAAFHREATRPTPFTLTADELAELAAEDARAEWLEEMAEIAAHNRHYRDGDWSLNDWLEWSPVGRGEAAAYARSTVGMSGEAA